MSNGNDPALVFSAGGPGASPGAHVLIVGVGKYAFGAGPSASAVGGDLRQLSSPRDGPGDCRLVCWVVHQLQKAIGERVAAYL